MKLPNAERAVVEIAKIRDYSSLLLGPGLAASFDNGTGILSIVPEPSRSLLLMLGLMGVVGRTCPQCLRTAMQAGTAEGVGRSGSIVGRLCQTAWSR